VHDDRELRVGFRVGWYPCLTETFIAAQINGLAALGHQIAVLADRREQREDPLDSGSPTSLVRYVWPRHRLLADALQKIPYRARRRITIAAERLLCAQNDIVICNFGWAGAAVAASVAGRARRARLVTIFHGDDMSRTLRHGGGDLYRQLFTEGDLLLPISDYWRRRLVQMGAPEHKLVVHRMGVDPQHFTFTPRQHNPGRPFEIVTLGRLVEKKGTATTLHALARLRQDVPQLSFRFRIYGDGPLKSHLLALRQRLELGSIVDFAGPCPHDRVRALLASSHAFVLPSATAADGDMEGIPVVLMEAMASGVPVISTRHSGIPELVEDGVNGLLVDEHDAQSLAQRLAMLASDPARCAALARAGRLTVERDFNSRRQNDRLNRLLHNLATPSPEHSPLATTALGEA
jgi:colanic acid/amylovoran biosynthesis glycosyltransferase